MLPRTSVGGVQTRTPGLLSLINLLKSLKLWAQ